MDAEVSVSVRSQGGSALLGQARVHSVNVDRPVASGGTDSGPMGGELLLLALGGCFMSTFIASLSASGAGIDASDITLQVVGTLGAAPGRFTAIVVRVSAPSDLKDSIAKHLIKAERGCIVHNTIKGSVPVTFDYESLIPVAP